MWLEVQVSCKPCDVGGGVAGRTVYVVSYVIGRSVDLVSGEVLVVHIPIVNGRVAKFDADTGDSSRRDHIELDVIKVGAEGFSHHGENSSGAVVGVGGKEQVPVFAKAKEAELNDSHVSVYFLKVGNVALRNYLLEVGELLVSDCNVAVQQGIGIPC